MDWEMMRQQWRSEGAAASSAPMVDLEARDRALHRQVRRRDLVEAVAAAAVALFFSLTALGSMASANWAAAGFSMLLVAYAVFVPVRLRRARRGLPVVDHDRPLAEGLARQRDAALAQARMLEQVWLWYLTPPGIGIAGLTLATGGITRFTLAYLAAVLVLYVGIGWLNRHVARTKFRAHAARLQHQIDALGEILDKHVRGDRSG